MERYSCILTLDIGTTACKAVLFNTRGEPAAEGQFEYPMTHPRPMWAEQDPEDWWRAAREATRQALSRLSSVTPTGAGPVSGRPGVLAIGLSSQRETVALLDGQGQVLGPAISWMDRRGAGEVRELVARYGPATIHRHTGMVPDATFTLAKLLWLRHHRPEHLDRARYLLQPRDFVAFRLTGQLATDPSLASRTMMWDIESGRWWDPAFEEAGLSPDRFPPVLPSSAVVGRLHEAAAAELGLLPGTPVVNGGGDRCCEALGAGVVEGTAMESTGTTSNLSTVASLLPARRDPLLTYTAHVIPGQWLVEQGLNTTGAILRWLRGLAYSVEYASARAQGQDVYERMSAEAGTVSPGADGLSLLPFFMGARAPRWEPAARGVLFGLTLEHTRAHLVRAAMEGVAFELRAAAERLRGAGIPIGRVVAMGGGSRSPVWLRIKAATLGVPYGLPRHTSAASLGAMVLAGYAVGMFEDPAGAARRLNPVVTVIEAEPSEKARYDALSNVYERLVAHVMPLFEQRAVD